MHFATTCDYCSEKNSSDTMRFATKTKGPISHLTALDPKLAIFLILSDLLSCHSLSCQIMNKA